MGRPNKKVTTRVIEDDPPRVENQSLEKNATQDQALQRQAKPKNNDLRIRRTSAKKEKRT